MNILIAGLGYLGQQLARSLQKNHHVIGVKRGPLKTPYPLFNLDLRVATQLEVLPEVETVVISVSAGGRSEAAYRESYLGITKNLRQRYPSARLLFVSSTSVYGQVIDEELTEDTIPTPTTDAARVLRETELLMLNDANAAVIRPSGIYGPGRTRFISQLATRTLDEPIENRECRTNRIHRDDLASLLVRLIEEPHAPSLVLASDKDPATIQQVDQWLRAQAYFPAFQDLVLEQSEQDMTRQFSKRKSRRLHSLRLSEMGFEFAYPSFRQGYAALIQELLSRKHGGQTPTT